MSDPVTVTHKAWVDITSTPTYTKKASSTVSAEEARNLLVRAVAGQAKAVASSELGPYHRHVKVHTSAARPDAGIGAAHVIANMDNESASEMSAKTITEPLRGCQHDGLSP
jgi:hypothetical protein